MQMISVDLALSGGEKSEPTMFLIQLPVYLRLSANAEHKLEGSAIYQKARLFTRVAPVPVAHKVLVCLYEHRAEICPIGFSIKSDISPIRQLQSVQSFLLTQRQYRLAKPASILCTVQYMRMEAYQVDFPVFKCASVRDFYEKMGEGEVRGENDTVCDKFRQETQPLQLAPEKLALFDFYFAIMYYKFSKPLVAYLNGDDASFSAFVRLYEQEVGSLGDWKHDVAGLMYSAACKANFKSIVAGK